MTEADCLVCGRRTVCGRRKSVSLVAINCEPGQIRKEAAAAIHSGAEVGLASPVSSYRSVGIDHMQQDPVSARIETV